MASSRLGQGDFAADLVKRLERLQGNRATWEAHWEEIVSYAMPTENSNFSAGGIYSSTDTGEKKTNSIFDSTAVFGLERLTAIMESLLTPRTSRWHSIEPADPELAEDRDVRIWCQDITSALFRHRYAPAANFCGQCQQHYYSTAGLGTGVMYVDELSSEPGLRYRSVPLNEVYPLPNHQGIIDTVFRVFLLTARQARQKRDLGQFMFLPEQVENSIENDQEREFCFAHVVLPREEVDYSKAGTASMPFASYYLNIESKSILSEGGYDVFPYIVSRYSGGGNGSYGRSAIMSCLPSIKTLNAEKRILLKQGHRIVDPVMLAPAGDDGALQAFRLTPGAINPGGVTPDGRPLIHTLPTGNVAMGLDLMQLERSDINDACMVSLFRILEERPQATATEIIELAREKGILLGPTIGRQFSEFLGPLIAREVSLLARQGRLPPPPEQVLLDMQQSGGVFTYRVKYESPLSRSQQAEEAAGATRTFQVCAEIANATQDPAAFDILDTDWLIRNTARIAAMPERGLRAPEEVASIRGARSRAAQEQAMAQAAPGAAALLKAGTVAVDGASRGPKR